jgi:2-oxoglutarate dehydrogenase E1 component
MTPKSLLRDPRCTSSKAEFIEGKFQELFDDLHIGKKVDRVLFCTGKIYYDLFDKKNAEKRDDVAIVRIEQLHPLPAIKIQKIIAKYSGAEFFWVQEEPMNNGYWSYLLRFQDIFSGFKLISRKLSSSPATGFSNVHKKEQAEIITKAFSK